MKIEASQITPRGRAWLERPRAARPLHVFDRVCNVVDDEGVVLSVQLEQVPLNPVSLSIPLPPTDEPHLGRWIERESPVTLAPEVLTLAQLEIGWRRAEVWDPRPDWEGVRGLEWTAILPALIGKLRRESPEGGVAPLVDAQGKVAQETEGSARTHAGGMGEAVVRAAREPVNRLLSALAGSDRAEIAAAAGELAGLGVGLTPSGDDLLIGAMHALWAVREGAEAEETAWILAGAAAPQTRALSATWLWAAAAGETMAIWHDLFAAAEGGQPELERTVTRLLRVGHSSGSDALVGFVLSLGVL